MQPHEKTHQRATKNSWWEKIISYCFGKAINKCILPNLAILLLSFPLMLVFTLANVLTPRTIKVSLNSTAFQKNFPWTLARMSVVFGLLQRVNSGIKLVRDPRKTLLHVWRHSCAIAANMWEELSRYAIANRSQTSCLLYMTCWTCFSLRL